MTPKKLANDFFVSAQIGPEDMPAIAALGIRAIIVNRPDGEEAGQASFEAVKQAALLNGLRVCFLPVVSGQLPEHQHVAALGALMKENGGPALAYCRSGTRSTILWALAEAHKGVQTHKAIIDTASRAGYDISRAFR